MNRMFEVWLQETRQMLIPPSFANSGSESCTVPLLASATYMSDEPKALPELIAKLRVGSMISGECSACHEVILVKGSDIETPGESSYMISKHSWNTFGDNTPQTRKTIEDEAPSTNCDDTPGARNHV
jgi:hypothetical protein